METTRRGFFRALAIAAPIGATLPAASGLRPLERFGKLTVDGWMVHKSQTGKEIVVLLNGKDVTQRCCVANDRKGFAILLRYNKDGRPYIDGPSAGIAKVIKRGKVQFFERSA